MNKYKLYYDAFCPICTSFASILKNKLDQDKIEFVASSTNDGNFKLILPNGSSKFGQDAINELANTFPTILNYFWMLPNGLKKPALDMAYKIGSTVRKVIKKTGGCGCKNKK